MICCPSQAPLAEVLLSTGARAFFCPILTTRTLKWRKREDKERQICNKQTSNTDVSFQPIDESLTSIDWPIAAKICATCDDFACPVPRSPSDGFRFRRS